MIWIRYANDEMGDETFVDWELEMSVEFVRYGLNDHMEMIARSIAQYVCWYIVMMTQVRLGAY